MTTQFLARNRSNVLSVEERREAARQKAFAEAWADPGGMAPAIPCKVLDISGTGAKIAYSSDDALPDVFVLHTGRTKRSAKVMWRSQNQVGVEFRRETKPYRDGTALPEPEPTGE
jgi:hypothetical protein